MKRELVNENGRHVERQTEAERAPQAPNGLTTSSFTVWSLMCGSPVLSRRSMDVRPELIPLTSVDAAVERDIPVREAVHRSPP